MRIISQDKMIDTPYDGAVVYIYCRKNDVQIYVSNIGDDEGFPIGTYNSKEDAIHVMELIREDFLLDCFYFLMPDAKDVGVVSSCSDKGGEQK